jgi:hypothetical protein
MDDFPQCMHIALLRVSILKSRQGLGVESFLPGTALSMDWPRDASGLATRPLKQMPTRKGKDKMHRLIKRPEASLAILL